MGAQISLVKMFSRTQNVSQQLFENCRKLLKLRHFMGSTGAYRALRNRGRAQLPSPLPKSFGIDRLHERCLIVGQGGEFVLAGAL